ncbi:hypothetical protein BTO20_30615 [Mycobacterium dioxanotrophicus]|uniref:Uncharacterized protein n=1 Tax=Mycobacterium dioxanotrophicus TaxID=482462 RepID=A0A1Y0CAR6_9MYCO|nr:hypothetical protein [Mycobacterium dioxanotrophicus]ART72329.1 hypothetical protein BTO20_30615 [Mycobacterium dioxanotrophicus]
MRKLGSRGRLVVVVVVLVLVATCYQFRGAWSARLIDSALRRQPGVTFVTHTVSSDNGFGVRTASFNVYVSGDATADQLSALGHTLATQIHDSWVYGGLGASFIVMRSAQQSYPAQSGSTMYVRFEPSRPTPEAPWRDWLALSKGDYAYEITGSAWPDNTDLTVALRSIEHSHDPLSASEFATSVRRLVTDFPDSTVGWTVFDADTNNAPRIRSDRGLPNQAQLALWQALDQIAPIDGAFNVDRPDRNSFTLDALPPGPDVERVVIAQLQLIKDSGLSAAYEVEDAQITVRPGGCSKDVREPQPQTPAEVDLQARLRTQFEQCRG